MNSDYTLDFQQFNPENCGRKQITFAASNSYLTVDTGITLEAFGNVSSAQNPQTTEYNLVNFQFNDVDPKIQETLKEKQAEIFELIKNSSNEITWFKSSTQKPSVVQENKFNKIKNQFNKDFAAKEQVLGKLFQDFIDYDWTPQQRYTTIQNVRSYENPKSKKIQHSMSFKSLKQDQEEKRLVNFAKKQGGSFSDSEKEEIKSIYVTVHINKNYVAELSQDEVDQRKHECGTDLTQGELCEIWKRKCIKLINAMKNNDEQISDEVLESNKLYQSVCENYFVFPLRVKRLQIIDTVSSAKKRFYKVKVQGIKLFLRFTDTTAAGQNVEFLIEKIPFCDRRMHFSLVLEEDNGFIKGMPKDTKVFGEGKKSLTKPVSVTKLTEQKLEQKDSSDPEQNSPSKAAIKKQINQIKTTQNKYSDEGTDEAETNDGVDDF